jgi:ABC-type cobalt transport system substrate-binding protein
MAKETKFIQVDDPDDVEETIEEYGIFGWELVGAPQEIFNKIVYDGDSRTDSHGSTTTVVHKDVMHYVKITFQRDKAMPNYAELRDLEEKYHSVPNIPERPKEPEESRPIPIASIFLCALSAVILVIGMTVIVHGATWQGLICLVIGIAVLIASIVSTKRLASVDSVNSQEYEKWKENYEKWKENIVVWEKKCDEIERMKPDIIERAKALLT